ncbi:hypothetical protein VULLAG_LOCUS12684 [Vulpes lagopus]
MCTSVCVHECVSVHACVAVAVGATALGEVGSPRGPRELQVKDREGAGDPTWVRQRLGGSSQMCRALSALGAGSLTPLDWNLQGSMNPEVSRPAWVQVLLLSLTPSLEQVTPQLLQDSVSSSVPW